MPTDPLRSLIKAMFVMLVLAAAALFVHFIRATAVEQQRREAAVRRQDAEEMERYEREREKVRRERTLSSAEMTETRTKERAALEAIEAKKKPFDVGQAFEAVRIKAEAGDPDAQALLGYIYLHGMPAVLSVNPKTFGISCSSPHASALIGEDIVPRLSDTRFVGFPRLNQDLSTGLMWYERAAAQGHHDSQASLAAAYAYGPGKEYDGGFDGYKWCLISYQTPWPERFVSRDGHTDASRQLCRDRYERSLSVEYQTMARKAAEAFRPVKE
jgi:TPR repeat protein